MICARCGHENQEDAQFCSECGNSLAAACPNCGATTPADAKFCPNCGHALTPTEHPTEERKLVTVLFADITGSTSLGERLDPEDFREVMDTYFDAMREEIEAEGGTVEKFIGDAVMAAFGVPNAHEDDPTRALRAALLMNQRLEEVNKQLQQTHKLTLQVRIGVNTGEVLANIDPRPGEPMVTGDVVNAAARLQTAAEPGQILVADRSARAVRGFRFDEIGALDLTGKEMPVKAHLLLPQEVPEPRQIRAARSSPMVGRDAEMELLRSVYARVKAENRPNLTTIYGEAGIGKSRLTREFVDRAEGTEPTPLVLHGRCLPYGDGVTYWPLAEILKSLAGIRDSDSAGVALEAVKNLAIQRLPADVVSSPDRAASALAFTVGAENPDDPFSRLPPKDVQTHIHSAWRALLQQLSQDAPLIVVIEDIHWADGALLDLLDELANRVTGPVMFICPSRPVLIEQRPGWGGGRRNASSVELDPLSHEEADQLIGFLLAIDDLPTSTREQIVDKADGNPFFLEEIVQQLMDRGFIENVDGRWRATTDIDDFDIPDTVQAALAARIDLLEPAEKRVLQRAAVVGRIFWPGPVGRLLESDDDLLGILDRLEERDLVRSRLGSSMAGEPEFIFKHVLTREVAYDTLPRRERGDAHATVADWIERTSGDRHGEVGDLLVYHYTEALRTALEDRALDPEQTDRLRRKSFESSLLATQAARFRHARQRSLRLAEQVVGLAEGDEELAIAQEERGRVAVYVYHGDLAWRSFKEAADIYYRQDEPNRKKIAEMCAEAVQTPTRWPGSMKGSVDDDLVEHYIQRGLDHLEEGQDSEERVLLLAARCLHLAAFGSNRLMRPEDEEPARQAGLEAAETARRMGSVALESLALDAFSGIESQLGLFGAHHEVSSRRLHLIEDMEDINEIGDVHAMAAWGMVAVGEYQDAIELARAGVEMTIDEASGFSLNILSQMSVAQFFLGDWKNLWAYTAPTARNILGDDSDDPPYFTTHIWASDAVTKAITGHPDAPRAAELLWKLESNAPGTRGVGVWASWLRSVQGEDPEEQLDTVLFASEIPVNRYLADIAAADIMFQFRSLSRAKEFVSESRAYASRAGMKAIPVHLDRLEATMALENGDLDLAREYADRAAQGFVILDSRWDLARTRLLEAEIRLGQNEVDEARDKTVDALQVFEDLGALRQISAANEMLRRLDA